MRRVIDFLERTAVALDLAGQRPHSGLRWLFRWLRRVLLVIYLCYIAFWLYGEW